MGNQQSVQPTWSLIKKPTNYPDGPASGKLELIWNKNSHALYHRFSPYSQYDANQSLIRGFTTQPYHWVYPDENKKGLNALRKYESRLVPIGAAPIDVIRVSKFLGSGQGIIFLGKQFLLQTGNAFNETRIYNPTSPIVAAGMGLALGSIRPMRNFDTSAGLAGLAGSLFGSLGSAIFGKGSVNPPSGTTGTGALPLVNVKSDGKGLIRGGTARVGLGHLDTAWGQPKQGAFGLIKSLFANFIPQNQSGATYRSDEGTYGKMIADANKRLWMDHASPTLELKSSRTSPFQLWVAGGKTMRKGSEKISVPVRQYGMYGSAGGQNAFYKVIRGSSKTNLPQVGEIGYDVNESTNALKPGIRYGDNVGVKVDGDYAASDITYNYGVYANPETKEEFLTKRNDSDLVRQKNLQMRMLLDKIRKASGGKVYSVVVPPTARVITSDSQNDSPAGYDRLFATNDKNKSPMNYPGGVMQDYRNTRNVDNTLTSNPADKSLKLPTAGHFDSLNTLTVLGKDQKVPHNMVKGWTKWQPYLDDQIAFFLYDVVNEKYIPFRAAIKGISETGTAAWEEMQFIGRGDKVYSYAGFNRNLAINLKIVMSSLVELAPTWQRINYLSTLIKPANYTRATVNDSINRFMVPPMVMLTVGDMYKDQPILIQSVAVTVPDDASWETQHQINGEQWSYLADYIKAPASVLYGQLPREVDISLGIILLEKERAIVGGANFGHAPRQDRDYQLWNTSAVPNGGSPAALDASLVVSKNNDKMFTNVKDKSLATQDPNNQFGGPQ